MNLVKKINNNEVHWTTADFVNAEITQEDLRTLSKVMSYIADRKGAAEVRVSDEQDFSSMDEEENSEAKDHPKRITREMKNLLFTSTRKTTPGIIENLTIRIRQEK